MTRSASPVQDILARARSAAEAVDLMVAAGLPRAAAQEAASLAFGHSEGDVPKAADRTGWASHQAADAANV